MRFQLKEHFYCEDGRKQRLVLETRQIKILFHCLGITRASNSSYLCESIHEKHWITIDFLIKVNPTKIFCQQISKSIRSKQRRVPQLSVVNNQYSSDHSTPYDRAVGFFNLFSSIAARSSSPTGNNSLLSINPPRPERMKHLSPTFRSEAMCWQRVSITLSNVSKR